VTSARREDRSHHSYRGFELAEMREKHDARLKAEEERTCVSEAQGSRRWQSDDLARQHDPTR